VTDHDDQLLLDFRSEVPSPDADTAARIRRAAMREPASRHALGFSLRRRRAGIALAVVTVVLVGGSVSAAVIDLPWWERGTAPIDPQSVASIARENLPAKVDTSRARTVAQAGNAALVAVPLNENGYCLIPSLARRANLGGHCAYQVVNAEKGESDLTRSLARAPSSWLVYGRITEPRAAEIDLGAFSVQLEAGGFFLAQVPEAHWKPLDGHANVGRILDSDGATLRTGCVNWGPSPVSNDAARGSVPLWTDKSGPCRPQSFGPPTVYLDDATKLVELRLASAFSTWNAGTVVALWQAPADQGMICTYVAAASPAPTGISDGLPGGPGQCYERKPQLPWSAHEPLMGVSFSSPGGGLVTGQTGAGTGVAKVVLESAAEKTVLPLGGGWFIGQLPEGGAPGELPPGGPFTLIAYDAYGKELARKSLEEIRKSATPD